MDYERQRSVKESFLVKVENAHAPPSLLVTPKVQRVKIQLWQYFVYGELIRIEINKYRLDTD